MKIRKIKLSDIPELVKLVRGEKAVEDYSGEYSAKVFKQMMKDKDTIVLVVEEDKEIAEQCQKFSLLFEFLSTLKLHKAISNFLVSVFQNRTQQTA
ncbi:hypothetical protein HYW76_01375 [Candidatus Pacearchaeota archaeon]|nr:hypothetical protein [Candidatus Pacearchaeota archaeon]